MTHTPSIRDLLNLVEGVTSTGLNEQLGPPRTAATIPPRLFHGTYLHALYSIISQDWLYGEKSDEGPKGISLSRDFGVAKAFSKDRQEAERSGYEEDFGTIPPGKPTGGIIELDGSALIVAGYEVRPYVWDKALGALEDEEAEDRVVRRDIKPLSAVLTAFYVARADLEWFAELHQNDPTLVKAIHRLIAHPKRREMP